MHGDMAGLSAAPVLRPSLPGDEAALKTLWKRVFGDEDDFIELFFRELYAPGRAVALISDGGIVSAMYALPEATFSGRPLSYGYALATLPERRGRGYGALVTRELMRRCLENGAAAFTLLPADEGLREWYAGAVGTETAFWARETRVTGVEPGAFLEKTAPERYFSAREALLDGRPHAVLSEGLFAFAGASMEQSGGGLYRLGFGDASGCAAVERDGEGVFIKELLLPDGDAAAAARGIAASFGAETCRVRAPVFQPGLETSPVRAFVVSAPPLESVPGDAYFGLTLD